MLNLEIQKFAKVFVLRSSGKNLLQISRRRLENKSKVDTRKILI